MKNSFLLLVLFVVPFLAEADNWDLFPFNQKTYYYFQTGDLETIAPYYMDYEEVNTNEVLQYPLRTYIESLGICYPVAPFGGTPKLNDVFFKSSSNNKIQAYIHKPYFYPTEVPENIEELQDTLFFYPHIEVGSSWEIHAKAFNEEEFPFTHLVITCSSANFENIIEGVEDSTKTFHIQAFEGENAISSDFDQVSIKLSKQYGLLEWTAFSEWFTYDLKTNITFAGIEAADGTILGERTPLVEDFFPYEAGDTFTREIRRKKTNSMIIERYKHTITEVGRTDSSISYTYNREISKIEIQTDTNDTLEISYTPIHTKTATEYYFPQQFIDMAYWELGIGELEGDINIGLSSSIKTLQLLRLADDICGTSYILSIEDIPCSFVIETTEGEKICDTFCLPSDCDMCQKKYYHSHLGLTALNPASSDLNHWYSGLIEASIGDCYFTNIKEETHFASQITLHPNPTQNRFLLQLQNPKQTLQNLQLKITDIHGRTLQQLPVLQSAIEIDLSDQPNGIYLVQVSDGTSWWTEKVVKY